MWCAIATVGLTGMPKAAKSLPLGPVKCLKTSSRSLE